MTANEEVAAKVMQALDVAAQCSAAETSDNYAVLNEQLEEIETLAKQILQSHASCGTLEGKLQNGSALTADEMKTLRTLIVGDADYYLKYDDDFDRSKAELGRILDQLRRLSSGELDAEALIQVRVLCQEACSVLIPAERYLEQRERVQRFEEATQGQIDTEAGRVLAKILNDMVAR
ncbi:MAG: hypothetical protein ACREDV_07450 [Methylocella sp.]